MDNKHSNLEISEFHVVENGAQELWCDLLRATDMGIEDAAKVESQATARYHPAWGVLRIMTRESRDPLRSTSGGEYYFYTVFRQTPDGVSVQDEWSCDICDYDDDKPTLYVGVPTLKNLVMMLQAVCVIFNRPMLFIEWE